MTADKWEALKDLFERALDCKSLKERSEFLSANCEADRALRDELESLLTEHGRMSAAFLEQAPIVDLRQETNLPPEGSMLGSYRLERRLGRGGMGTVYLAARADGAYQKQVAIKLVSAVGASEEIVRRFLAERQILARLDHPNIAHLVDGGTTAQGQPYLVMDYVDGIPIDRYCRERRLSLDQRLELFERVCRAVDYAHKHRVVHRDIKPGNILVTADGTPKLLDFGIAKVLRPDTGDSESRRTLLILGTPEYCSPEQVSGRTVTEATDVYSLGVLLYELLTDRSPYHVESRAAHEMARVICEEDPEPPSSALSRTPSRHDVGAGKELVSREDRRRSKRLSGDLDNIVMMALRKEPEQRYQSVSDFTEDIRRHVEGLPVHARPRTWRYRGLKFVRRQGWAAAAAVAFAAVAFIATMETVRQGQTPHGGEVANRRIWDRVGDSVSPDGRLLSLARSHDGDLALHDVGNNAEHRLTSDGASPVQYAASSAFSRDGRWLAYTWQPGGVGPPPMELRIVSRGGSGQRTVFRDSGPSWLIVHDWTDGQHVLVSSEQADTKLLLVSIADGSSRRLPVSPRFRDTQSRVMGSPDGRYAAYAAEREGSRSTEIRVISLATAADAALFAQPSDESVLGWAPDGSRLVFSSNRSGVGGYDIWSVPMENGQAVGIPERFGPTPDLFRSLGITKQGALFYAASNDSDEVFLSDLDTASGKPSAPRILSGRFAGAKTAPIWSPDGRSAFYVAANMLHLGSLRGGAERDVQPKLRDLKRVVRWHPNGRSVFEFADGADGAGGLFLIDIETGATRKILEGKMENAALSPDGNTLYIQGGPQSRSIVARNLSTGQEKILYTRDRRSDLINARLSLSPDGQVLAMQLWDVPPGSNSLAVLPVDGGEPHVLMQVREPQMLGAGAMDWSPDGRYLYAAWCSGLFQHGLGYNDHSEIWRLRPDSGAVENIGLSVEGTVRHLHLSPDGRQVMFQTHRSTGETWVLENFLPALQAKR
jgi:serine/threonine protein kinase/Tol biopolymer transport system component